MWQPLASAVYFCIHHSRLRRRTLIASSSATATLRRTSCRKNSAPSLFFPPGEKRVWMKVGEGRGAAAPEASRRFREATTEVHLETPNLHNEHEAAAGIHGRHAAVLFNPLNRFWRAGGISGCTQPFHCYAFTQQGRGTQKPGSV